ncbi:MAG: ribonuclease P protein component [Waddliaceae bacterium]
MNHSFPKSLRLQNKRQFREALHRGKRWKGSLLIIDLKRNRHQQSRLGITVAKRYGTACRRNRFKRLVREAFRLHRRQLPNSIDIIVRPLQGRQSIEFEGVVKELIAGTKLALTTH